MHGEFAKDILAAAGLGAAGLVVVLAVLGLVIGWLCGRPLLGAGAGAALGLAIVAGFVAWLRWGV